MNEGKPKSIQALAAALSMSEKALDQRRRIIRMNHKGDVEKALLAWLERTYEEKRDTVRLLGKSGGYTESFVAAVHIRGVEGEQEPEAIPHALQEEYSRSAWETFEVLKGEELAKREQRSRLEQLRQAELELRQQGKPVGHYVATIQRVVEQMKQDAKAA